jgi:hypothetical protein
VKSSTETEAPIRVQPRTDKDEPNRIIDLRDKDEPRCTQSSTAIVEPNLINPKALKLDEMRPKPRRLSELPR